MCLYLDLKKISCITSGILIGNNIRIKNICVDTRSKDIFNSLFIALKGNNINAYSLCIEALLKGSIALLVDCIFPTKFPQIIVNNTKEALYKIAKWVRFKFINIKFLALTGTSGKTTVKEILVNILKKYTKVLYTKYNFNTDINICLTIFKLIKFNYNYVVLEVGGDCINDIFNSSRIIYPNIALINNFSPSHIKGFKNLLNLVIEKGKIFNFLINNGVAIINANSHCINIWRKYIYVKKILFFSVLKRIEASIYSTNINITTKGSKFVLNTPLGKKKIFIKLLGIENIANVLAAVSFLMFVDKISFKNICLHLSNIKPIKGRLCPIYLNKTQLLLDDTYNSNPRSALHSIKFLNLYNCYKVLVISDMAELGFLSVRWHMKVGFFLYNTFIDEVLSIGVNSIYISKYSKKKNKHFFCVNNLIVYIKDILCKFINVVILIKGSRVYNMDFLINILLKDNIFF